MQSRRIARRAASVLILLLVAAAAAGSKSAAQGIYGFPIIVTNPLAIDRVGEPVASGLPTHFPGFLGDPNATLQLVDDQGNIVPCQFKILSRWHGPVTDVVKGAKWILIEFLADVTAGQQRVYSIRQGARAPGLVTVQSTATELTVGTGPATFILDKTGYTVFKQVKVGGQTVTGGAGALEVHDVSGNLMNVTLTSTVVEEQGDVRSVVAQKGTIGSGDLAFTVRYYFWTGRSDVKVDFRLENHGSNAELPYLGTTVDHAYFEDLRLKVRVLDAQSNVSTTAVDRVTQGVPYQLTQTWAPPTNALQMLSGFAFTESQNGVAVNTGGSYDGAIAVNGAGGSVAAAVDRFWQNFPKAFDVSGDTLRVDLYPAFGSGPHHTGQYGLPNGPNPDPLAVDFYRFEGGRWKTHTVVFDFKRTTTFQPAELVDMAKNVAAPMMAQEPLDWPFKGWVFGTLVIERRNWFWPSLQRFERFQDIMVDDNAADNQPSLGKIGFPGFRNRGGTYGGQQMYGWENFGDIAWGDGYSSLHYDMVFSMLLNFFRTGDYRFFDFGRDMVAHRRDYDQWHGTASNAPRRGGQAYEKGYFHGNYDGPQPSHNWIQGLLLWHVLTGDEGAREAAVENFGFIQRNHPETWSGWWGSRILGWQLEALVDLYNYLGDPAYLSLAEQTVARFETLEQANGGFGYVPNPAWTPTVHEQTWMHCIVLDAIGKYYMASLNPVYVPLMKRMADWILSDVIKSYPSGPPTARTTAKVWGRAANGYHTEPSGHHVWVTANALTWAAASVHDNNYLVVAGDLFESITRYHQVSSGDDNPRDWTNPSTYSPIAFRMTMFPNSETKIMGNVLLWSQAYPMVRMLWDNQW